MGKDLISRKSLIDKLKNQSCSNCPVCNGKCMRDELLAMIQQHPAAYDADWVEGRLTSLFKHHAATKTVQRLVLETVRNGYSAAADMDRHNKGNLITQGGNNI